MKCEIIESWKQTGFSVTPIKKAIECGSYTKKVRKCLENYLIEEIQNSHLFPTSKLIFAKYYRFYTNRVEGVLKDKLIYNIENGLVTMDEIAAAKAWGYYTELHEIKYQKTLENLVKKREKWDNQNFKKDQKSSQQILRF